jgi:hypothetical protein
MGYARAGFEVVGVDINRQPNYPFHAIQGNAIAIMDRLVSGEPWFYRLADFDVIHASPPASCDHSDVYNPWAGADRSAAKLRAAMDIDWLPISGGASRKAGYTGDLFNAIPPAYTEWIGAQLMREVTAIPAPVETSNGHRARSEARPAGAETVAANSEMRPSGRVAGSV